MKLITRADFVATSLGAMAVEANVPVQNVEYLPLQARLLKLEQKLERPA